MPTPPPSPPSRAALAAVFPEPWVSLDAAGHLRFVSELAARLLRSSAPVLEGTPLQSLPVDAVARAELLAAFEKVVASRATMTGTAELGPAGGCGFRFIPALDEAGRLEAVALVFQAAAAARPATDAAKLSEERAARVDAEQSQRRLNFLYQATSTIFSGPLDPSKRLETLAQVLLPDLADWCVIDTFESDQSLRRVAVHHWDPERLQIAARLPRTLPDPLRAPSAIARVLLSGQIEQRVEMVQGAPDDPLLPLRALGATSYTVLPLRLQGQVAGTISLIFSESTRRYDPADLPLLEDVGRVAAIAVDNARLLEQAQRAVASREELIAVVSHDLRNPLNAVLLNASMLGKLLPQDAQADRRRQYLERLERSARQMTQLINLLLDAASIEAGRLNVNVDVVGVDGIVREAVELIEPIAISKGLRIESRLEGRLPNVLADRARVLQVFSNLLGNAVKFTPKDGRVTVGARADGREVVFTVADTGPGISAADLPRVFDRFVQAGGTRELGHGLGLYIVRGIVAAHGGQVGVTSFVGEGTTFRFTLPVAT